MPEPESAGFDTAQRCLHAEVVHQHVVDTHATRLDAPSEVASTPNVSRPNASRKPERRRVGECERLLRVLHRHDRQQRTECLLVHHGHVRRHVREHGRLEEVPLQVGTPLSTAHHPCAARDRVLDLGLHHVDLRRKRHRADVHAALVGERWNALPDLRHFCGAERHEVVRDRTLHQDALGADAHLPAVGERAPHRRFRRAGQVRVRENDHGRLAAQLQDGGNQTFTARPRDPAPNALAAGEEHHVGALDKRRAGRAASRDDLKNAIGQPGRDPVLPDQQRRHGRPLGGLQNGAVSRDQRRDAVGKVVEQRPVPWADDNYEPPRVANDPCPLVREHEGAADFVLDRAPRASARVEAGELEQVEELDSLGLVERLSALPADRFGHGRIVAQATDEASHDCAALRKRNGCPRGLGCASPGDGLLDFGHALFRDLADQLTRRGVGDADECFDAVRGPLRGHHHQDIPT